MATSKTKVTAATPAAPSTADMKASEGLEGVYSIERAEALPKVPEGAAYNLYAPTDPLHVTRYSTDFGHTMRQVVVFEGALATAAVDLEA